MKRLPTKLFVLLLLLAAVHLSMAFSLLGPFKAYQVQGIGYNLPGDIGGPMTLGEGYRWNLPTITYAYDQSFIDYFGSNGMAAVDAAVKILSDLPPFSQITNDASSLYLNGQRVPTDNYHVKYEAQALGLRDLKSTALVLLLEEMGLAEPERWVWALRGRGTVTVGGITFTNYSVIKLNYDPITRQTSSYVNGALYTYRIDDPIGTLMFADARESSPDKLAFQFSSVAGGGGTFSLNASLGSSGTQFFINVSAGQFFPGLTQDDVAGLRFLYNTNNLATELLLPNVVGGVPLAGGGSPWTPYFVVSNFFAAGTNFTFSTNVAGTNLIVQGLRPGIGRLHFQRVNFDSLLGQTAAFTNLYTDTIITNGRPLIQPVRRIITRPDIVFAVGDLGLAADNVTPFATARTGTPGWQNNDAINGSSALGGPGVITPPVTILFTELYPFLINRAPGFVTEDTSLFSSAIWASFDGTTNAPIIYPAYGSLTVDDLRRFFLSGGGN